MQILVNTDHQIKGTEDFSNRVSAEVEGTLGRFSHWLTRVEVHLTIEGKGGKSASENKRCIIEARPAGLRPVSVSHDAATLDQAVTGAAEKMERLLDASTGKMRDMSRKESIDMNMDDESSESDSDDE